ncbi:hypothetical protein E4U55_005409 [Claviceps digitariae]|nr:hypothetical protein E4U55_005409 [Claviceps digitariae]
MLSLPKLAGLAALVAAMATPGHALPQAQMASSSSSSSSPSSASSTAPAATSSSSSSSTGSTGGHPCNNSPTLCGRPYNAVTYMGAHNSAFLRDQSSGDSLSGNQFQNAIQALDSGLRLLQVQVHKPNSTLKLCHTSCSLLDAGALDSWLSTINDWMGKNPHDVVTILLVNSDKAPVSDFASAFERSGLSKLAYRPASDALSSSWPTLQSMIDANTRLVSFITSIKYSSSTPHLLPELTHIFETPYEVSDLNGFNCTVDRPSRASPASTGLANGFMSLVNHFKYQSIVAGLEIPDLSTIDTVNSAATSTPGNLGAHLQQCKAQWNRAPNFVLVDFWNRGDVMTALDAMNGVTDATGRRAVAAQQQQTGDESRGSATHGGMGVYGALVAFLSAVLVLV